MRFSTVVASMLPLSALAAPSLVKRQYDGQQYDSQQYDGNVNQYVAWLHDSKDYMGKAYDYGWKIDSLHETFNQYKYKEAWDNLDYETKQFQDYHAPKQEVYVGTLTSQNN